jgi:methyltransferase (TIGR00027 family)
MGQVSVTAQRVAARRLTFPRVPGPYGDPEADQRLGRDIAGPVVLVDPYSPMTVHLAARTAYFDRATVRALDGGIAQVVVAGAGYDGRALRYAKPGVRWFEIDHPATQADKVARLARLAISAPQLTFVAADFATADVGAALAGAGHDRAMPSLFLCEGVAVYLDLDLAVIVSLLRALRSGAAPGSRLAISVSAATTDERRRKFQSAVCALGEPLRTILTAEAASELLASSGWQELPSPPERRARSVQAGFLSLEPV